MNSCPTCYGTIRNRPGNVSPEGTRVQLCSDKWHDLTPLYAALDALSARVAKLEAALLERTVRMAMADEYLRRQKGVHSAWSDTSSMTTEEWDKRDPEVRALNEMERYGFCAHDCLDLDSKTIVGSEAWNREMEKARAALEDKP